MTSTDKKYQFAIVEGLMAGSIIISSHGSIQLSPKDYSDQKRGLHVPGKLIDQLNFMGEKGYKIVFKDVDTSFRDPKYTFWLQKEYQ